MRNSRLIKRNIAAFVAICNLFLSVPNHVVAQTNSSDLNNRVISASVEVQRLRNQIETFLRERGSVIRKEEIGFITGSIEGSVQGDLSYTSPFARAFSTLTGLALGGFVGSEMLSGMGLASAASAVLGGAAGGATGYLSKKPDATGKIEGKLSGTVEGRQYSINNAASVYGFNVVSNKFKEQMEVAVVSKNSCIVAKGRAAQNLLDLDHTVRKSEMDELAMLVQQLHRNIGEVRVLVSQLANNNSSVALARQTEMKEVSEWLRSIAIIRTVVNLDPSDIDLCNQSQAMPIRQFISQQLSPAKLELFEYSLDACLQESLRFRNIHQSGLGIHPLCEQAKELVSQSLAKNKGLYTVQLVRPLDPSPTSSRLTFNSVKYKGANVIADQLVTLVIWGQSDQQETSPEFTCRQRSSLFAPFNYDKCLSEYLEKAVVIQGYLGMPANQLGSLAVVRASQVQEGYLSSLKLN